MKIAFLVTAVLLSACTSQLLRHDQIVAARAAEEFARTAILDRNFNRAAELSSEHGASVNPEQIQDVVGKMHPDGEFPTTVKAEYYEPMPGQKAMKIYLRGEGDGRVTYYKFVMYGSMPDGYVAGETYRLPDGYPQSTLRRPL